MFVALKPLPTDGKIAVGVDGGGLELVYGLRLGSVGLDIVVEKPTVVFVNQEVSGHKLAVNVVGSSIRASHAFAGHNEGAD